MISFTIHGRPHAKQRVRFSRKSGRAYTPGETVSFERQVAQIAVPHFPVPLEGPVKMTVLATFVPPKSWSKKKVAELMHRPHTNRPDADNVGKSILDGLNRIAFADDGQVYELTIRKVWGQVEKTEVFVESVVDTPALMA